MNDLVNKNYEQQVKVIEALNNNYNNQTKLIQSSIASMQESNEKKLNKCVLLLTKTHFNT